MALPDRAALDPRKHALSLLGEFKAFALKGNVLDLAVGVIIAAAFGKIVESLVKHIMLPLISTLMPGDQGYVEWKWQVGEKTIPYGLFLGEVVNFLLVSFILFIIIVKLLGWIMRQKKKEETAPPPPLTKDQELLVEIRDLLRQRAPTP